MSKLDPPQTQRKKVSDLETVAVSFADLLDTGETLATLTSVLELTTTDLTLGDKAISTAVLDILEESTAIGEAVQFSVDGGTAGGGVGGVYQIQIKVVTDSTPTGRKLTRTVKLIVEAD